MPLPHSKGCAQHRDRPCHTYSPDEGHTPHCQWQLPRRHLEACRQLLEPQAPTMLCRRQTSQTRVDVLSVDCLLQPCQLPTQIARPLEVPLEQRLLEPAVEVLHTAVELRLPSGDEHGVDTEAQAEPDHPRQRARRRPPAGQFAGVVELNLLWDAEILPALAEEPQDLVHAAGVGQTQADGTVESVLADPDVVAVTAALEVDRPDQIDLVELGGGSGLRARPLLTWQQGSHADSRGSQAVAFQDALDGALAGEWADAQGLQFGEDGSGAGQAVASGWRGVSLQPTADGEDGPLQFG